MASVVRASYVAFTALKLIGALYLVWLGFQALAARAAETLQRHRVRAALDRVTGVVLIGLGLRLAIEHR